ncbi:MAG: hypothetical protein P4L73_17695 [Caulobacteraceae bacterium]|nr:hypothetical protein [Caulobacteraceae bacterium]
MTSTLPPRVEALRQAIVAEMPCSLDTAEVRAELDRMPLPALLQAFYSWASRRVPPRPRHLIFAPGFWDRAALQHETAVYELAGRIRRGEDLSDVLSEQVWTKGYVPKPVGRRRGVEWGGKDFALNAWEVHHLHLRAARSKELLYVMFSYHDAIAVMLGDHRSFDDGTLEARVIATRAATGRLLLHGVTAYSGDRVKLARHGLMTVAGAGGKSVMGAVISTDGSSVWQAVLADRALHALQTYDPLVDEPGWLSAASPSVPIVDPAWGFHGNDLCLISKEGQAALRILPGRW